MMIDDLMTQIEDGSVQVHLALASDLDTMIHIAGKLDTVRELEAALIRDRRNQTALFFRILSLSRTEPVDEYRNPRDLPLAVYICLLYRVNREFGRLAASYALVAKQCWRASQAVHLVLATPIVETLVDNSNVGTAMSRNADRQVRDVVLDTNSATEFTVPTELIAARTREVGKYV